MTIADTISRQWHMLRMIPRGPRRITVQALRQQLKGDGFETTDRTVQRDLVALSARFPLINDEDQKPFGWSWAPDATAFDLPGLSLSEAITWALAEQHLANLLPASVVRGLKPHFKMAHSRLEAEAPPRHVSSWLSKIRSVPPAQPLLPPRISEAVQATISDALFHERQVEIDYRKRGSATLETWRVHPLALVQRGAVLYLHARIGNYPDARNLPLHRIERATELDDAAEPPADHDVDWKLNNGIWHFGPGNGLDVELRFSREAGEHLFETPLSTDQRILEEGGALLVSARVSDTPQLRWWLRGFADGVEVLAPASLRTEMADTAKRVAMTYARAETSAEARPPG